MKPTKQPFNLQKWIDDNRHLLKPPVGNKNLYTEAGDYIVMIVAGPNARNDYHYNETEELFYQIEGDIVVKTQQNGNLVEVPIKEGEMFLLPAKIPHSPVRSEGSIGLVIEPVDGLIITMDKWSIETTDTIGIFGMTNAILLDTLIRAEGGPNECVGNPNVKRTAYAEGFSW